MKQDGCLRICSLWNRKERTLTLITTQIPHIFHHCTKFNRFTAWGGPRTTPPAFNTLEVWSSCWMGPSKNSVRILSLLEPKRMRKGGRSNHKKMQIVNNNECIWSTLIVGNDDGEWIDRKISLIRQLIMKFIVQVSCMSYTITFELLLFPLSRLHSYSQTCNWILKIWCWVILDRKGWRERCLKSWNPSSSWLKCAEKMCILLLFLVMREVKLFRS